MRRSVQSSSRVSAREVKELFDEKYAEPVKTELTPVGAVPFERKTRLFGMIKAERKINPTQASKYVGIDADEVRGLIYDLVGEGRIEGEIQGDDLVITSDVTNAIAELDEAFKQ